MKVLFLTLVCLFAFNFVVLAQSNFKLEIGAELPRKYADKSKGQMATHPSQFRPFIIKTVAKVRYTIAFEEKSRRIRFIHTVDKNFRTANGLRVGSKITVSKNELSVYPSWYIFAPETSDEWLPIVGSDLPIVLNDKIEDSLSNLKDGETKTVTVLGFIKGGN